MSNTDTGGPAFPRKPPNISAPPDEALRIAEQHSGMTLRQYAAIKLKVPYSGTDWLDDMITKSLRDDIAAKAMQGICASGPEIPDAAIAAESYNLADATLKARGT